MLAFLHAARAELAAVHPLLPYLAIAVLVGGVVYAWRRLAPSSFQKLPDSVQALPAVMLSAVLAAASTGDDAGLGRVLVEIALGAFSGLLPVGGHEALKRSPLPYLGGAWPAAGTNERSMGAKLSSKKPPPLPIVLVLLGLLGVFTPSCGPTFEEACTAADLAAIERAYHGELAEHCAGMGEDCPAFDEITERARKRREAWVRCDGQSDGDAQ